jgi:hypothetical protein
MSIKRLIKEILLEARKKKTAKAVINIEVPTNIIVKNSKHNSEQMCCRPSCSERPDYPGCYDIYKKERKVSIRPDSVINGIIDREGEIIKSINSGRFKKVTMGDTSQHMGIIKYHDGISNIWSLLSLSYIKPFEYMVRVESSRRWNGGRYFSKTTTPIGPMNEVYFNVSDNGEVLHKFNPTKINTSFNISYTKTIKEKISNGINVLDYVSDDIITINDVDGITNLIKANMGDIVNNWGGDTKENTYTNSDIGLSVIYHIKHEKVPNITKYTLTIVDITEY